MVPAERFKEGAPIGPAYGAVAAVDRAPHPSAAKLYINWLLSREGQEFFKAVNRVPSNLKIETPLNQFPHEIIDPAIALDEGDKWDKLFSNLFLGGKPVEKDE